MPRVRPRQIWIGVAVAVSGMVTATFALTVARSQPWLWAGLGLVAVGVVVGLLGGMMQDVRGKKGVRSEARDVVAGESHPGATASSLLPVSASTPDDPVSANAGADEGVDLPATPPSARLGLVGILIAVLGGWLVVAPMALHYPDTGTTDDVLLREYVLAGVLVLSGLWLRGPARHPATAAIPAVAGACLLLLAALGEHVTTRSVVHEAVAGLVAVSLATAYAMMRVGR